MGEGKLHGKRPTVSTLNGVVAAAHPLAAAAGARILSAGGNAFDAAAATAAALNVVEPYMSGMAGQGLATCWIAAENRVRCLDFLPAIPEAFPVERFKRREDVLRGPLAVGGPGNLAGWAELVSAHGRKALAEVFAPAVTLAREGYPLIEFNVEEINGVGGELRAHATLYPTWAGTYTDGSGRASTGWVLKQPDLAATFEALAAEGTKLLYGGALGRKVVDHVAALGGVLTLRDLETVKPVWKDPVTVAYRGLTVNVPPPPCEGFQFLLTLRILDGFDLGRMERNGVEHIDTVLRAIRLAAGVRIANNQPSPQALARLLGEEHVEGLRERVRGGFPLQGPAEQWMPPPAGVDAEGHTTSFSIADRDGNVICLTQSLGSVFGSGVVVPGTGICLNNFLFWSDVNPQSPNRSKPGGLMPNCMSPSISIRDGRPALALGTPGSYGILQTQAQALIQHVDFGLPLQEAIEAPRGRLMDGAVAAVETRLADTVLDKLGHRGHAVERVGDWTMKVGGMQGIAIDPVTGAKTGACDPRRDGYVVVI